MIPKIYKFAVTFFLSFIITTLITTSASSLSENSSGIAIKIDSFLFKKMEEMKKSNQSLTPLKIQTNQTVETYIVLKPDFDVYDNLVCSKFEKKLLEFDVHLIRRHWDSWTIFARIPLDKVESVAALDDVRIIRLPGKVKARSVITAPSFLQYQLISQAVCDATPGDIIVESTEVIDLNSAMTESGCNIKIGLICPGIADWDLVQMFSEIPAGFDAVTDATGTNILGDHEGTAMMEILHDIAPDAQIFAAVPQTDSEYIASIEWLKNKGVDLIVSDIGGNLTFMHAVGSSPYQGQSTLSKTITNTVLSDQIPFILSVSNDALGHYENTMNPDALHLHQFNAAVSNVQSVTIPRGGEVYIELSWNEQFGQAVNNYDLYALTNAPSQLVSAPTTYTVVSSGVNIQSASSPGDPYEIAYVFNNGADAAIQIAVQKAPGAQNLPFEIFIRGATGVSDFIYDNSNASGSTGLPEDATASLGLITVGAAHYNDSAGTHDWPQFITTYSGQGTTNDGRTKPDIIGPDGVTTSIGFIDSNFSPFIGTSAASPHVAGVVALMIDAATGINPAEIHYTLADTAKFMDNSYGTYPNNSVGYGFLNANDAVSEAVLNVGTISQNTISLGALTITGDFITTGSAHQSQGVITINDVIEIRNTDSSNPIVIDESAQTISGVGSISIPAIPSLGGLEFYSGALTIDNTGFLSSFDPSSIAEIAGTELSFGGLQFSDVDPSFSGSNSFGIRISDATVSFGNLNISVDSLIVNQDGLSIETGTISASGLEFTLTNASFSLSQILADSFTGTFDSSDASSSINFTNVVINTDGSGITFDAGTVSAFGFTLTLLEGTIGGDGGISITGAEFDGPVDFPIPAFTIEEGRITVLDDIVFQIMEGKLDASLIGGFTFGGGAGFVMNSTSTLSISVLADVSGATIESEGLSITESSFTASSGSLELVGLANFSFTDIVISKADGVSVSDFNMEFAGSGFDGFDESSFPLRNFRVDGTTISFDPDTFSILGVDFALDGITIGADGGSAVLVVDEAEFDNDAFNFQLVDFELKNNMVTVGGGSIEIADLGTLALVNPDFEGSNIGVDSAQFELLPEQGGGSLLNIAISDLSIQTDPFELRFNSGELSISDFLAAQMLDATIISGSTFQTGNVSLTIGGVDTGELVSAERIRIDSGSVLIEDGGLKIAGFEFVFSVDVNRDDDEIFLAVSMSFPADKLPWPDVAGSIGLDQEGGVTVVTQFGLSVEGGSLPGTDLGLNYIRVDYQRNGLADYGHDGPVIAGSGEFAIPNYFTLGMGSVFFENCMDSFWVSVSDMNLALGNSGVFFQDIYFGAGGFCSLFNYPCTEITYETKWDADVSEDGAVSTSGSDSTSNSLLDAITSGDASGGYLLPVHVSFRSKNSDDVSNGGVIVNPGSYTKPISFVRPYGTDDDEYYRTCEVVTEVPGCEVVLTFELGIALSAGPRVSGVALAELQATGKFDTTGWMLIKGELVILSFNVAGSEFEINPSGPDAGVRASMYVNLLGVLKGDAEVRIDAAKKVSGNASTSLSIPEDIPIIGGKDLGTVKAAFGDSKISGSAEIKIIKTFSFGFKFEDGRVSFSTKTPQIDRDSLLAERMFNHGYSFHDEENRTVKFLTNWDTLNVNTPSSTNKPYYKPGVAPSSTSTFNLTRPVESLMVVVQAANGQPDVELTSPAAIRYTTDYASDPNVELLDFAEDTSGLTSSTTQAAFVSIQDEVVSFMLIDPPLGSYSVTVNNSAALSEISVEILLPNAIPAVVINSITKDSSNNFTIDYNAFDIDNDANIEFYLDSDYEGGDGFRVAEAVDADGNSTVSFNPRSMDANTADDEEILSATDWDGDGSVSMADFNIAEASGVRLLSHVRDSTYSLPSGTYYLAAKIDDDANAPVINYGPKVIITNPNAPSKPQSVKVLPASGGLMVTWEGSSDPNNDLVGYKVVYTGELNGIRFGNSVGVDTRNSNNVADVTPWFRTPSTFAVNTDPKQHSVFVPDLVNGCPYRLAVIAYDTERNDSEISDVVISAPIDGSGYNHPHITSEPIALARSGKPYQYTVEVRDFDEGDYTVTLDHAPSWMKLNEVPVFEFVTLGDGSTVGRVVDSSYQLNGIPSATEIESTTVSITATDSTGLSDTQTYLLLTSSPIEAVPNPLICSRPDYTAYTNQIYEYQVVVCQSGRIDLSDFDNIKTTMSSNFVFALVDAPIGMTIDASGLIQWNPTISQIGSHRVVVRAIEKGLLAESPPRTGVQAYHIIVQNSGSVMDDGGPVDNTFVRPTSTPLPPTPTPTSAFTIIPLTFTPHISLNTSTPTPTSRFRFFTYFPTNINVFATSTPTPTPTSRFNRFFIGDLINFATPGIVASYSNAREMKLSGNGNFLFVLNDEGNTFSSHRFDASSGSITQMNSISLEGKPIQLALTNDDTLGVLGSDDGRLHLIGINQTNGGLSNLRSIQLNPSGAGDIAAGIAISPDNLNIYVITEKTGRLISFERKPDTNELLIINQQETLLKTGGVNNQPVNPSQQEESTAQNLLAISSGGKFVYQLSPETPSLIVYTRDTKGRLNFRQSISLPSSMYTELAMSKDESRLLVKSSDEGDIIIINRDQFSGKISVLSRVSDSNLLNSLRVVYDPKEPVFYAAVPQGIAIFAEDLDVRPVLVHIIRNEQIASIDERPLALQITPDGSRLLVMYPSRIAIVRLQRERQVIIADTPTPGQIIPTPTLIEPLPTPTTGQKLPTSTNTKPPEPLTPTPTQQGETPGETILVHDLVLAQGEGGQNLVQIRNGKNEIVNQYRALNPRMIANTGGGSRASYVSVGDVNSDGVSDFVNSFGPAIESGTFTALVTVMDSSNKNIIGHTFSPFPPGSGNATRYNGGELRTAVGRFISPDENLLAVAQGFGSQSGMVRLFRYTGEPAPRAWQIVTQFQPLDNVPSQNNANGGVTVSAGDVDGDGLDELIVGQTGSPTSLTQFSVIDIDLNGNHQRHNFVTMPSGFRGSGGTEIAVVDLNGDGKNELVAAGMGIGNSNDAGSVISVIVPVIENGSITGFVRPVTSVLKVVSDTVNPGGGLSIAAGEFDANPLNGQELLIGSGKGAPQSFYKTLRVDYDSSMGEFGTVTDVRFLTGPPKNLNFIVPAFLNDFNPSSGAIHVGALPQKVDIANQNPQN